MVTRAMMLAVLAPSQRPSGLFQTLLMAVFAVVLYLSSTSALAANQGRPGQTSTATMKITLRIYPKPEINGANQTYLRGIEADASGRQALEQFCRFGHTQVSVRGTTTQFQIVADNQAKTAACNNTKASSSLLIAPL